MSECPTLETRHSRYVLLPTIFELTSVAPKKCQHSTYHFYPVPFCITIFRTRSFNFTQHTQTHVDDKVSLNKLTTMYLLIHSIFTFSNKQCIYLFTYSIPSDDKILKNTFLKH